MSHKTNKIQTAKYSATSFLPLNLYRQFSKYSNVFFFITLILLLIPVISPFPPYAYLSAFLIVVGISIVKDGIEDFIRHQNDKKTNERIVHKIMLQDDQDLSKARELNVLESQEDNYVIHPTYVQDLKIYDVVALKENEEAPGDMILLNAKIFNGNILKCRHYSFVQTSSLDGETNLKKRSTNLNKEGEICLSENKNQEFYICDCDKKILRELHALTVSMGGIDFNDMSAVVKIDSRSMLQTEKNIILRGTHIRSTTMIIGLIIAVGEDTKIAKNQHKTDLKRSKFEKKVERKMFYMFVLYFSMLLISCIISTCYLKTEQARLFEINSLSSKALQITGTNYILYSYLIPLSLFVMIEIARVFQKIFIMFDIDMKGAYCRNSNVTEDIGMIDLVLSDKTGTLTENKMKFNFFDIGNGLIRADFVDAGDAFIFLMNLLCNNGLQIVNGKFEGISQDEVAIVEKLQKHGFQLENKEDSYLDLKIGRKRYHIKILATLEFNSQRQRMSTIVQFENKTNNFIGKNDIFMFTKGSDQRLSQCLKNPLPTNVNSDYRSLLAIHRKIKDQKEFEAFMDDYKKNMLSPDHIEKIFENIEKNMEFGGIVYLEDQIGFKVEETVQNLRKAGIKFWMVTGDKKETALSCGRSIKMEEPEAHRPNEVLEFLNSEQPHEIDRQFFLSKLPDFLIVYRAIPDRKAEIAKCLVQKGISVLSIGDGNNDVSMINVSTVGVGIKGKEGSQASLAGDFSLTAFSHLNKLLFYHGRNNLIRFSKLTINSFFKNIFLMSFQFNFNFTTGFSGLSVFDYYFVNYFNILYSSFIPFTISIFDKSEKADDFHDIAKQNCIIKSYQMSRNFFSGRTISGSVIFGILKGTILYWLSFAVLDWSYTFSKIYFSWVVFLCTFQFQTYLIEFFNIFTFLGIFMTTATFIVAMFVFNKAGYEIYGTPVFYLALFAILVSNLIMDMCFFRLSSRIEAKIK